MIDIKSENIESSGDLNWNKMLIKKIHIHIHTQCTLKQADKSNKGKASETKQEKKN